MITDRKLYPLTFTPVLKDYIWGGRNLSRLYGRTLPPGVIAESWEIAAHEDGTAVVNNGFFKGMLLTDLLAELGLDLVGRFGTWAYELGKFPLLIKLLDANSNLSVQVHPDDEFAMAHEGNELGKTEMWVVLHATPEAALILGVKKGTTPAAFRQAIDDGDLELFLHRIPVKAGDVICVPSRSLHAILRGSVIAEIQQNSNTTYRVFDWNRLQDGKPRPLHIDKAMAVINFQQVEPELCRPELISSVEGVSRYRLCHNRYFVTERVDMSADSRFAGYCDGRSLETWGAIKGGVDLEGVRLETVQFALLPAALGAFEVHAIEESTLLRTYLAAVGSP